ncbi:ATP-binding protein [Megalodesulfovibrio paquesii]
MRFFPGAIARSLPFATKLGLGISAIVLFVSVAITATFHEMASRSLTSEGKKWGRMLCENLALRIRDPLLAQDLLRIKNHVDELKSSGHDVAYAFVMDAEGHVLAHTFQSGFPVELPSANPLLPNETFRIQLIDAGSMLVYDFAAPVVVAGNRLGVARVGLSKSGVEDVIRALIDPVANVAFLTMILAVALATLYARRVTRRINLLREHAASVVAGRLELPDTLPKPRVCWKEKQCSLSKCPVHGDGSLPCWYIAGNLAAHPECFEGKCSPITDEACANCEVYLENAGDEIQQLSETFNIMTYTLRLHLDELHAAERELTRQKELMRTILDATPDFVALQDREHRYMAVNKAFAEMLGQSELAIIGQEDATLLPDDEGRRNREALARIFQTGRREEEEIRRSHEGQSQWLHVVRVPVKDDKGRVVAVVRSARDVSQLKSMQDQLIQAQKMESLGKLAGGVAHEINTPLGVILGYSQLLQEDVPAESSLKSDLQIIEKQAKVCRKIVADLLGFSRQAASAKMEMCFNNSLMEAVTLVRHTFLLDKVEIQTRLDDRLPIIYGDPEKLKQVWINLLNNARDAMPCGGLLRVSSRLESERGVVIATFSDTGDGIAPENLPRIFDPFFSTKGVGQGTGLGLSVSFGIIKDHGGAISVLSPAPEFSADARAGALPEAAGPGSQFIIELPLDHSDLAPVPAQAEAPRPVTAT